MSNCPPSPGNRRRWSRRTASTGWSKRISAITAPCSAKVNRRSGVRRSTGLLLTGIALLLAIGGEPVRAENFPPDSGALNVRDFGAKGNGRDDDTAALLAAIAAAGSNTGAFFWRTRIVYLPAGTYRVSAPLVKRYADGKFGSGLILVGESAGSTTIRLTDHASGFDDPAAPRGIIMTTAKLLDG